MAKPPSPYAFDDRALYILGAGFSCAAGLPLASDLWKEICRRAMQMTERAGQFKDDLNSYLEFRNECEPRQIGVDFEKFLGYLDVQHLLGLRGKDTWSGHGNETQMIVKTLIGQILAEKMPKHLPDLYLQFARKLCPGDIVITFNYDPLVENASDAVGVQYRLVQERYTRVYQSGLAEVDTSKKEVVILKLHGSIDWFDRRPYRLRLEEAEKVGFTSHHLTDPIFNTPRGWALVPVAEGDRPEYEPLREVFRLREIKEFYQNPPWFLDAPVLITPSTMKIGYAGQFKDLWWGLDTVGIESLRMAIIGYSLPAHDEYALQFVYTLVKNYQTMPHPWSYKYALKEKRPLALIDCKTSKKDKEDYRKRYSFVDWKKARVIYKGFTSETLNEL